MKLSTAILCGLFFGFIGIFFLAVGLRSAVRGEYLSAITALGFVLFCFGLVIPLPRVLRREVAPRVEVATGGMTIRPDRRVDVPVIVAVAGGTVACALVAILLPIGHLDLPVPASGRYAIPFGAGVLVVLGLPQVVKMWSRGSTKYLRLMPNGFAIAEGLTARTGEWSDVVDVTNAAPEKEPLTVGSIVLLMSDGGTPTFSGGSCTPDSRAARRLTRLLDS